MTSIVIVGAGGFGREVAAYIEDIHRAGKSAFEIKGFLDDKKPVFSQHAGHSVLGSTDTALDLACHYIIAVGNCDGRRTLAGKLSTKGAQFVTLQHPQSYIAVDADIAPGCIISPFAFLGPRAKIGSHCLINTHSCVGHESAVGAYSILAPHATLHGLAALGENVFVGSHSVVTAQQKVGDGTKIAAGSVVYSSIPSDVVAMGNPALYRKGEIKA